MRATLLGCVSVCALSLASMAAAQDGGQVGQCFDSRGKPLGPVYEMSKPNHQWINWVQSRSGVCRPLYSNEVAFFAAQKRSYDPAYTQGNGVTQPPASKAPAAAPRDATPPAATPSESSPPPKPKSAKVWMGQRPAAKPAVSVNAQPPVPPRTAWTGDPARAARMLAAAYSANGRDRVVVIDTGRTIERNDGIWRVFQVRWADGVVVPVGVRATIHGHMDFERLTENYPTTSALNFGR